MVGRSVWLTQHPTVFRALTGISAAEYRRLVGELLTPYAAAAQQRLARAGRRRAIGGGRRCILSLADHVLLTIVWLRQYPTFPVLGYLFGLDNRPASHTVARILPLLDVAGRDSMRPPDPGPHYRQELPQLLQSTRAVSTSVTRACTRRWQESGMAVLHGQRVEQFVREQRELRRHASSRPPVHMLHR